MRARYEEPGQKAEEDTDLLLEAVRSSDAFGPHLIINSPEYTLRVILMPSMLEILHLYNWCYHVLKANGNIPEKEKS